MLAIDIETYDPLLHIKGDGSIRKDGYILCAGIYDGKNSKVYMPDDPNWQEFKERFESSEEKVFHNGVYDLAWLCCGYNLKLNGTIHDTMTRMALIDEYKDLDLDSCCKYFSVAGKNKNDTIKNWYARVHNKPVDKVTDNMVWKDPLSIWNDIEGRQQMIKYNLQDCKATYDLFYAQEKYMAPYKETYQMECDLYPLLMYMKKHGVRIDEKRLAELRTEIENDIADVEAKLVHDWGITPSIINSPKQLAEAMHALGITSPIKTAKGAESFSASAFDRIQHPVIADIQAWKAKDALLRKYLNGSMANSIINGRIHCTFSPNKREKGGTITGRFSCSHPNLQNIPARDKKHGQKTYGQEMRELFLPEEGQYMAAFDYSQIEYVLMTHYAYGPQAEWAREQTRAGVDFHTMAMNMTGIKERFPVKCINYGILYGMGLATLKMQNYTAFSELAAKAGKTFDEYCNDIYYTYLNKLPVVKDTMRYIENQARVQGYVTSIGGRRHHKPKSYFKDGKWNDGIYKITNYLIQGGAAEVLKNALVKAWKLGLFNVLTMHISVHDENVFSVPKTKEGIEAAVELEKCMNESYNDRLLVPIKACGGIGENWGAKHAEEDWQKLREQYGFGRSD